MPSRLSSDDRLSMRSTSDPSGPPTPQPCGKVVSTTPLIALVLSTHANTHLHHYMREHSCRYGFIITEIELVCVRAGTESVPNFGSLELAAIQLSDTGFSACLALWYLHMLAKEQPLPGQYRWRLEVGGAAACTRQKCLVEDAWIPELQTAENREAKRLRGWVLPTEPLHRREVKKRWHR
ncbi:MAG: hypothetical protein M1829_000654 [Trizodia sp. TS-e1964]|nr:MAG: hypothetical protein M1829_000654 [Trizodia sp. TS-e1964]